MFKKIYYPNPKFMTRILVLTFFLFAVCKFYSQSVVGRISDSLDVPIAFSPLALLNAKDSSIYKGTMSDEKGNYIFENLNPGNYLMKFSIPGFEERIEPAFKLDTNATMIKETIHLRNLKGIDLAEIAVSTIKRSVEFKNGNVTVNIENSALAAGNTAYDLLQKLPGVSINNDVVSIQGREGVKIMINDRIQQLSSKQLMTLLRSISGASIEKIEVLKNPPVKYDAAGTAGLINIKTKKTKITGFSGTATTSGSQGYYPRGESSFSLNYKTRRLVLFCDVSAEYGKYIFVKDFRRTLTYNSVTTQLNEKQRDSQVEKDIQPTIGFDWQLNKKLLFGMKATVGPGRDANKIQGNNVVSDTVSIYNRIYYDNTLLNTWNYMNFNVNAEYAFDTIGTKIIFSADYSPNWDKYTSNFDHRFLENDDEVAAARIFRTFLREDVKLLSSKFDFETHLSKTTSFQTGIKTADQELRKNYLFENKNLQNGGYTNDTSFSNHFSYSEKILGGYVNFEKEFEDFEISAGLRAENTSIQMGSPDKVFSATRNYFNLFPALSLEFEPGEKNNFQLSYNKRINRPDGYSYYPYKVFEDNLLVSDRGNPGLRPEYSNTFEFTHVYKGVFSNAIAYSRLNNYLLQYTLQNDSSKEITGYIANLKNSHTIGYTLFFELKIKNWWVLNGNASLSYLYFNGKVNDLDYSSSGFSSNALLRNELITGKRSKFEISTQFFGSQPLGVLRIKPKWSFNFAFKQKLLKEKLDFVIGVDDVFYTLVDRVGADFQNQKWSVSNTYDTKRIRLSLSYNFGKLKVERREVNSNEEEKERLKH